MGSPEDTHRPLTTSGKKMENNGDTVSWRFGFIVAGTTGLKDIYNSGHIGAAVIGPEVGRNMNQGGSLSNN